MVSTTQRCGSTWIARSLESAAQKLLRRDCVDRNWHKPRILYVNGLELGFRLNKASPEAAIARLAEALASATADLARNAPIVLKTHDVPSRDFARVCSIIKDMRFITARRDFKDVVVSRYFYYRYFWKSAYGKLPCCIAMDFGEISVLPDREALCVLLGMPVIDSWAREWAAFETEINREKCLRLNFEEMLDGTASVKLSEFCGCQISLLTNFARQQETETASSGRSGNARFHRRGISGEWKEWFSAEGGATLDEIAAAAILQQQKLVNGVV